MNDPNWAEKLTAWSTFSLAVLTLVIAGLAACAWKTAKSTLDAARASADAARVANEQARRDSKARTRPYVWVEILPGLAGVGTYDVRITNTGRTPARSLRLEFDSWPDSLDDVGRAVRQFFETPRTLPPNCSVRSYWRLEGDFTDGTTEAGLPKHGCIAVSYRGDEPSEGTYADSFDVMIDQSGIWPVPEVGPTSDGLKGESRKFFLLGQALVRRVGELAR